jgi:hypothetical protein
LRPVLQGDAAALHEKERELLEQNLQLVAELQKVTAAFEALQVSQCSMCSREGAGSVGFQHRLLCSKDVLALHEVRKLYLCLKAIW